MNERETLIVSRHFVTLKISVVETFFFIETNSQIETYCEMFLSNRERCRSVEVHEVLVAFQPADINDDEIIANRRTIKAQPELRANRKRQLMSLIEENRLIPFQPFCNY